MGLPFLWGKKSERRMLKEEEWALLEELQLTQAETEKYRIILERYKELKEIQQTDKKLSSYVVGKIIDLGSTLGLATVVLTHETWAPLASNWSHNIAGKIFNHNDTHLLM